MGRRHVTVAVLLMFGGAVGFGVTAFERNKEHRELAPYKLKYSRQADELLSQFAGRSELSPEEQLRLLEASGRYSGKWWEEQQLRLKADLEELALGEKQPSDFANFVYGQNWQEEVEKYRARKELSELTVTASTMSLLMGVGILVIGACRWLTCLIDGWLAWCRRAKRNLAEPISSQSSSADENCEPELVSQSLPVEEYHKLEPPQSLPIVENHKLEPEIAGQAGATEEGDSENFGGKQTGQSVSGEGLKYSQMSFGEIQKAFNAQAESLEQKTKEFELSVGGIEDAASESTKTADGKLDELAEQIGAIREYAAQQQERMKNLQEGYDWNIIRNFCLRIIRCIDNLEGQIRRLSDEGSATERLEQSKQELIFALESSGVEQFEVSLHSDYRGQERHLEVLKERAEPDDPQLSGKVAEVVRTGYQYVIDEENIKIVRPAQVRVYS